MAVLILALLELDATDSLKMSICKENSGTRSFADLLHGSTPCRGAWAHRQASWRPRAQQEQLFPHQI